MPRTARAPNCWALRRRSSRRRFSGAYLNTVAVKPRSLFICNVAELILTDRGSRRVTERYERDYSPAYLADDPRFHGLLPPCDAASGVVVVSRKSWPQGRWRHRRSGCRCGRTDRGWLSRSPRPSSGRSILTGEEVSAALRCSRALAASASEVLGLAIGTDDPNAPRQQAPHHGPADTSAASVTMATRWFSAIIRFSIWGGRAAAHRGGSR